MLSLVDVTLMDTNLSPVLIYLSLLLHSTLNPSPLSSFFFSIPPLFLFSLLSSYHFSYPSLFSTYLSVSLLSSSYLTSSNLPSFPLLSFLFLTTSPLLTVGVKF